MNKLYAVRADDMYGRLDEILLTLTGKKQNILRTEKGKPYIHGNPLYFSLAHSGIRAVIAVCDRPVGVDLELFKNAAHKAVFARFPEREQSEITCEKDFLLHWTVREAFVKMRGYTLAETLKSMEYYGGNLYFDGVLQPCIIQQHRFEYGVVTVCIEDKK